MFVEYNDVKFSKNINSLTWQMDCLLILSIALQGMQRPDSSCIIISFIGELSKVIVGTLEYIDSSRVRPNPSNFEGAKFKSKDLIKFL